MITKNQTIPAEAKKTIQLTANDKSLIIFEGQTEDIKDCEVLGEIPLDGLQAEDTIDITIKIDQYNILAVTYRDKRNGWEEISALLDK